MEWFKKHPDFAIALALFLGGIILYTNTLGNEMFWDDEDFILRNEYLRDWRFLPKFFSENVIAGANLLSNYWRPVLLLVFSLEWHLWGDWAPGYHFVSMIFHIADGILLYFLIWQVFQRRALAAAAAFIFLFHPAQVETVAYANSLGDSLAAFFIFGGMVGSLRTGRSSLAVLAFVLALLSKETAIVMPALLGLAYFFQNSVSGGRQKFKVFFAELFRKTAALWIVAGIYLILRATVLNFQNSFNLYVGSSQEAPAFITRFWTFFKVFLVYGKLLFWPVDLHMERTIEPASSPSSLPVILGFSLVWGLILLAVLTWRRYPEASFGIAWFFIALLPVSNLLVPINASLYEHWLYVPMIGIFLGVAGGIWFFLKFFFRGQNAVLIFLILLTLALTRLGILTIRRNRDWRDPITFYHKTLQYAPQSYRVINNLGKSYAERGDQKEASFWYNRAIVRDPQNPAAYHNLANIYRDAKDLNKAKALYGDALARDPKFVYSVNALVVIYLQEGKLASARAVLENYLLEVPDSISTLITLAQLALREQNRELAVSYLEKVRALAPRDQKIEQMLFEVSVGLWH